MTSSALPSAAQQEADFRNAIGELHAIDVVPTGADAAKEDRFHGAECLEHRLQFGKLLPDLGSQRCAHALVVWSAALQVLDPSQDRFLAARQRRLFPESIGSLSNSPRKFLFEQLCPVRGDPRREPRSGDRLLKQDLVTFPWPSRRKMTRSSWLPEKASAHRLRPRYFGRPVSWT